MYTSESDKNSLSGDTPRLLPGPKMNTTSRESAHKSIKRKPVTVVALIASVAIGGTYLGIVYFSQSVCPSGTTLRSFVIIVNGTTGYNDSKDQPFQMNVHTGDYVLVTFVNDSPTQSHGLAINYYLNNGLVVQPNRSDSAKFLATQNCLVF